MPLPENKIAEFLRKARELAPDNKTRVGAHDVIAALQWPEETKIYFLNDSQDLIKELARRGLVRDLEMGSEPYLGADMLTRRFCLTDKADAWLRTH
jgi:hypothetical protein